jgi:hypothetical protein
MEKKVTTVNVLVNDIKKAEKFFDRTGEDIKLIYEIENPEINEINKNGVQNIILYIPEAKNDVYEMFLN